MATKKKKKNLIEKFKEHPHDTGSSSVQIALLTERITYLTDHLKKNPAVCFELESKAELVRHETDACKFDFSYRSIIGFGEASEVRGIDAKRAALKVIMKHYSEKEWDFPMPMLLAVGVWKIKIDSLTGKQSEDNIR